MGSIELSYQQRAWALIITGFALWIGPLALKVTPFLQLLAFCLSLSCFLAVVLVGDDLAFESKLKRQQRMKRSMVTAAQFGFAEEAEIRDLQKQYAALPAAVESEPIAPVSGNQQSLEQAGEKLAKVLENCGEIGVELIDMLWDGKASEYTDEDGWISVSKLRRNWGERRGFKAQEFLDLLTKLHQLEIGEFKDETLKEWRLLLIV